ncbi:unnamed protein product [Prunus armeniaca]
MALKLDMSKAYDRIEWSFLEAIMRKLGFAEHWIQLMLTCISTVSYSFVINGTPHGFLHPSRGLHQGDPLSPYLFLFCAEGLTALIAQKEREGFLKGVSICRGAPAISHLFFADDSFLFALANMADCMVLKDILATYERASGQHVNFQKSAVCFSKNVHRGDQLMLAQYLGIPCVDHHSHYLGLPMVLDKKKGASFNHLKERLWKKLQTWKGKLLSGAGKEILIKVVAQAIPIYTMSCFLLPKYVCEDLNKLVAQFWWNSSTENKKIHWMAWDKLCAPKEKGGLGFRNLHAFNLALLAKQGWRLLQNLDSLITRVLKAKYFPNHSFLETAAPYGKWGAEIQLAYGRIGGCHNPIAFGSSLPSLRTVLSQKSDAHSLYPAESAFDTRYVGVAL